MSAVPASSDLLHVAAAPQQFAAPSASSAALPQEPQREQILLPLSERISELDNLSYANPNKSFYNTLSQVALIIIGVLALIAVGALLAGAAGAFDLSFISPSLASITPSTLLYSCVAGTALAGLSFLGAALLKNASSQAESRRKQGEVNQQLREELQGLVEQAQAKVEGLQDSNARGESHLAEVLSAIQKKAQQRAEAQGFE